MTFRLNTSLYQYPKEEDRLALQDFGFKFVWDNVYGCLCKKESVTIKINTIRELMILVKKFGSVLIMDGYIEIYDA